LAIVIGLSLVAGTAAATDLTSGTGFLFDIADSVAPFDGSLNNGTIDAYDGCYRLLAGTPPTVYVTPTAGSTSLSGRQVDLPRVSIGPTGLVAERHIYVPASGYSYARFVDVIANPTTVTVSATIAIEGNLGSDTMTYVAATSSGDTVVTNADDWFATDDVDGTFDPSLAHVFQGPGALVPAGTVTLSLDNIHYDFAVTLPPGGEVAIMHFAVQDMNQATVQATAAHIMALPSDVLVGTEAWAGEIINWVLPSDTACVGADGAACSDTTGVAGVCHGSHCCTGCWDGTRCHPPGTVSACGLHGSSCVSCVDASTCTIDSCLASAGVCVHANAMRGAACSDGSFCTATDSCDGAGTCVGTGSPCDDANACTTDACVEATTSCTHTPLADGTACMAATAGVCHGSVCCRGCWDGVACQMGNLGTACGTAGQSCRSCADGDACTSDVCSLGACSNPPAPSGTTCDDGLYCTIGDHCDGADHCVGGTGTACDDGSTCTIDTCVEATHACMHSAVSSICIIAGTCFGAGTTNPANPCQTCDPARNGSDWSPLVGVACGAPSCSAGTLTPAPTCSASGVCTGAAPMSCASGACLDTTSCADHCTDDASCGAGRYCNASGACAMRVGGGGDCSRDGMCQVGVCSFEGHCCDTACLAPCNSCIVPGHEGTCSVVPAGTDPDHECGTSFCDGAGACVLDDAGVPEAGVPDGGASDAGTAPDGSALDASMADAGNDAGDGREIVTAGCCSTLGARPTRSTMLTLVGLVMVIAARRRSRRASRVQPAP
jgi:hypothetical protein